MSDRTRRSIVETLSARPLSVGDIASTLPVSRPAVSQHLKVLLDAGLVAMRKDAQRNIYSLKREGFASMGDYIEGLWDTALQRYRDAARNEQGEMHE